MIKTRKKGFGNISTLRMILGSLFLKKENQTLFLEKAQKVRGVISKIFTKILDETDVLIFPTSSSIAPKINDNLFSASSVISNKSYSSPLLLFANFLGTPSISIPLGKHQKMPYGLNINSKIYNDEKLLSFSMYFEKILGEINE
jgi:aspartyl-tRNA(Asn)/glutamyl-tRNA(Gln) amidotransferase subunit A